MPPPVIIATGILNGGCLAGKRRVTAIAKVIIVWVIIRKMYAALVWVRVTVKVMVNSHFGKAGAIRVGVRWRTSACRSSPLAFLVLP